MIFFFSHFVIPIIDCQSFVTTIAVPLFCHEMPCLNELVAISGNIIFRRVLKTGGNVKNVPSLKHPL